MTEPTRTDTASILESGDEDCPFCGAKTEATARSHWMRIQHSRECFLSLLAQQDMFIPRDQWLAVWNARVSPEREALLLTFHDAAIQALAYIETPAKDSYQLSHVKGKAITKLRAALTEYEKQKSST